MSSAIAVAVGEAAAAAVEHEARRTARRRDQRAMTYSIGSAVVVVERRAEELGGAVIVDASGHRVRVAAVLCQRVPWK
jgi:hypothetical protein